jgi:hypothetical protein
MRTTQPRGLRWGANMMMAAKALCKLWGSGQVFIVLKHRGEVDSVPTQWQLQRIPRTLTAPSVQIDACMCVCVVLKSVYSCTQGLFVIWFWCWSWTQGLAHTKQGLCNWALLALCLLGFCCCCCCCSTEVWAIPPNFFFFFWKGFFSRQDPENCLGWLWTRSSWSLPPE